MKKQISGIGKLCMALLLVVAFTLGGMGIPAGRVQAKTQYYKINGLWVGFENSTGRLTWVDKKFTKVPKKVNGKTVKIIGEWCFSGNTKMKTAKIPNTVKKIEKGGFYGCKKLKNVKIPSSVKKMGEMAFYGCEKLTSVKIPSSVKKLEKMAFYGCKNLKKVVLPKKIKMGSVEDKMVFWDCNKLETVVNNPDKKWKQRIKSFQDALKYLKKQKPSYYVKHVREFKNQWVPDAEGDGRHKYTDKEWRVVEKKAKALTKGCKTTMEKAKKISKWIVGHLHYNTSWMEQFQEWRKTHDEETEVFPIKKYTDAYSLITWKASEHDGETATTTCGGYGNLTQALFCAAGIPCVHVHRVQKKGETIDHVFNAAYIAGKWIWLDNTYSDKSLNYFNCGIAGFAASDHRCDRLNLEYLSDLMKK